MLEFYTDIADTEWQELGQGLIRIGIRYALNKLVNGANCV